MQSPTDYRGRRFPGCSNFPQAPAPISVVRAKRSGICPSDGNIHTSEKSPGGSFKHSLGSGWSLSSNPTSPEHPFRSQILTGNLAQLSNYPRPSPHTSPLPCGTTKAEIPAIRLGRHPDVFRQGSMQAFNCCSTQQSLYVPPFWNSSLCWFSG